MFYLFLERSIKFCWKLQTSEPVSVYSTVSKIFEQIMQKQITEHIEKFSLNIKKDSAPKAHCPH